MFFHHFQWYSLNCTEHEIVLEEERRNAMSNDAISVVSCGSGMGKSRGGGLGFCSSSVGISLRHASSAFALQRGGRLRAFFPPCSKIWMTCSSSSPSSSSSSPSQSPATGMGTNQNSKAKGVVLVAGKFDAFHRGHRALVQSASEIGNPTLLSFSGMASELGWAPRAPVVAAVERSRILRDWGRDVNCTIRWRELPFRSVRHLSAEEFLSYARDTLFACAIVCGIDWRFGRGAAGDVGMLRRVAKDFGLEARVVQPVLVDSVAVSSTRVREAIEKGCVELAMKLMDRAHRVVGYVEGVEKDGVVCRKFVNMVPADGLYEVVVRVLGRAQPVRCVASVERESVGDERRAVVYIYDADMIYCEECEVYMDFVRQIK